MVIHEHVKTPILGTRSILHLPPHYNDLSFFQKIRLRVFGRAYVGRRKEEGWYSALPYYAFRCKKHGMQLGYPVGYSRSLLCLECTREALNS
jgi:hypothetical protein